MILGWDQSSRKPRVIRAVRQPGLPLVFFGISRYTVRRHGDSRGAADAARDERLEGAHMALELGSRHVLPRLRLLLPFNIMITASYVEKGIPMDCVGHGWGGIGGFGI